MWGLRGTSSVSAAAATPLEQTDLLYDYALGLTGKERPAAAVRPDGDRRVERRHRRLLRGVRRPRRAFTPEDVPVAARGPARADPLAGRDLRQRRQHREHARDLAGARHRRAHARGVGERRRPLGRERRDDLLVRARRHRLVRPGSSTRWTCLGFLPGQRLPALRRRGAAPPALPRAGRRRPRRGDRGRRRRRAPLRGHRARRGRRRAGPGAAPTASTRTARRRSTRDRSPRAARRAPRAARRRRRRRCSAWIETRIAQPSFVSTTGTSIRCRS